MRGHWGISQVRIARDRRYSIYSIKDGCEKRARGIGELRGQESTPISIQEKANKVTPRASSVEPDVYLLQAPVGE